MFIARTHELEVLERLYARPKFDMVVLYGRRRVGKTALIDQFVADKEVLYFTALQQSNKLNLRDFFQTAPQRTRRILCHIRRHTVLPSAIGCHSGRLPSKRH